MREIPRSRPEIRIGSAQPFYHRAARIEHAARLDPSIKRLISRSIISKKSPVGHNALVTHRNFILRQNAIGLVGASQSGAAEEVPIEFVRFLGRVVKMNEKTEVLSVFPSSQVNGISTIT